MVRNLRLVFMSMMVMLCGSVFAQTEFDFDNNGMALLGLPGESNGEGTDGDITETKTATIGNFSIAVSAAAEGAKTPNRLWNRASKLRLYSGTLTISSSDANIKSIEIKTGKWNAGNTASVGELGTVSDGSLTWSGDAKEVVITIAGNTQISKITVSSEKGDTPEPEPDPTEPTIEGGTTPETAITVSAALTAINSMTDGQKTTASYYVKGMVKAVTEISTEYGNATFTMVEDATAANELTAFRLLGLENQQITNPELVQDGDEVVVYGQLQKYVKNETMTPEIAQGGYIYSINGKTKEEVTPDPEPDPEPETEEVKTVSIADFNAAEVSTSVWYQLTGVVKNLKDGDQYGNFDLEDETGSVYVYGLLSEKGGDKKLFQELVAAQGIVNGSKLTLIGNRGEYKEKIEVLNAYFVSVDNSGVTPEPEPEPEPETTGEGTLENPYTVADALIVAGKLENGETSEEDYYVKGKISSIKYAFDVDHGTATFSISDNGEAENEFMCYSVFYLDNLSWQEGCTQIAVGDEVIIYGKFTNYKGTLETASKKAYIYSLNGVTTSGITEVKVSNRFKGAIFNMAGQRVTTPGKGLYIMNGRKFFKK